MAILGSETRWKLAIYCKLQNSTLHKNNDRLNERNLIGTMCTTYEFSWKNFLC